MPRDNSTLAAKAALRVRGLSYLKAPRVLETHGGAGGVFLRCYSHLAGGAVFEKDPRKAAILARQRPTWAVYEADCCRALAAGVGFHGAPNFVDVDPYGECWPVLDALFAGLRSLPPAPAGRPAGPRRLVIVVNDGLRQKLKMNGGWSVASMRGAVERHGNAELYANYLAIARELVMEKAAGYTLAEWHGYYCGYAKQMTHFLAVLDRAS